MKAFYPYGQDSGATPPTAHHVLLGAAEVAAGDRRGIEVYSLDRSAEDWLLLAQAFDEPWRLLGRVHHSRLPPASGDAGAELIGDLWSLRHAGRLRFVRSLELGTLGVARWQQIEERMARPALEQALRAEGHEVREVPGPVGTTEHLLLLRRA